MTTTEPDLLDALAEQQATVDAVATTPPHLADPEYALFIDACRHDGYTHGGFVSQNRVRSALSNKDGLTVNPRRYSGFWRRAQLDGLLTAAVSEEPNRDARGRNLGKPLDRGCGVKPYYSDDLVTLYHGDALDVLADMSTSVDLVVTDPPYIIGAVSAGSLGSKSGGWADMMNSALWFGAWYRQVARLLRHDGAMWSFCNWRTLPVVIRAAFEAELPITSTMVWDKQWIGPGGTQGLRPSYELACLFAKPDFAIPNRGVADVWQHKVGSYKATGHPAEKPVDLMRRIIRTSGNAGLVLDPFMGSGTTVVAAQAEGVRAIGIEAEEKWCELAAKRLTQGSLFGEVTA